MISKEDRIFASELDSKGTWKDKDKAIKALVKTNSEKAIVGRLNIKRSNSLLKFDEGKIPNKNKGNNLNQNQNQSLNQQSKDENISSNFKIPRHGTFTKQRLEELLGDTESHSPTIDELDNLLNNITDDEKKALQSKPRNQPNDDIESPKTIKKDVDSGEMDIFDELMNEIDQVTRKQTTTDQLKNDQIKDDDPIFDLDDAIDNLLSESKQNINVKSSTKEDQSIDPFDELIGEIEQASDVGKKENNNEKVKNTSPSNELESILSEIESFTAPKLQQQQQQQQQKPKPSIPLNNNTTNNSNNTKVNNNDDDILNLLEDFKSPRVNDDSEQIVKIPSRPSVTNIDKLEESISELLNEFDIDDSPKDRIVKQQSKASSKILIHSKQPSHPSFNIIPQQQQQNKSALDSLMEFTKKLTEETESIETETIFNLDSIVDQIKEDPKKAIKIDEQKPLYNDHISNKNDKMSASQLLSQPNLSIDYLQIKEKSQLGQGTWGDTYDCIWHGGGYARPVTMKKLYSKKFSMSSIDDLRKETYDLMKLDHPNIAKIVGCGVDEEKFILWQYIDGISLWGYLRSQKSIDSDNIIDILRQIAVGMNYLHSNNIIHGGLKSNNILIDKGMRVYIKDYAYMDLKDDIPLSNGSYEYYAPEIFSSDSDLDEKIDVYSFGVLLFEILTKSYPYDPSLSRTQLYELLSQGLSRPSLRGEAIPTVFQKLIIACWNNDSSLRPSFEKIVKILSLPSHTLLQYAVKENIILNKIKEESINNNNNNTDEVKVDDESNDHDKVETLILEKSVHANMPAKLTKKVYEEKMNQEEERKIAILLSKVSSMLNSNDVQSRNKALSVLGTVIKDDIRKSYINKKSIIIFTDMIEILVSEDIEVISKWKHSNSGFYDMIENVLKTLLSLLSVNETPYQIVEKIIPILCNILKKGADGLKILACEIICLLGDDEKYCEMFRKNGALFSLITMLYSDNEFVIIQTEQALSVLFQSEVCQEDFILAGGLRGLLSKQDSSNNMIRLNAFDALSHFWGNDDASSFVDKDKIRTKYMEMLLSENPQALETAIKGISKFAKYNDFIISEIQTLRILNALKTVLTSSSSSLSMKIASLNSIEVLTRDEKMYLNFRDIGGLKAIVTTLSSKNAEIHRLCLMMIKRILNEPMSQEAFVLLGGVAPFVSHLLSDNKEFRRDTIIAIESLIKYKKGIVSFMEHAGATRLVSIIAYSSDDDEIVICLNILEEISKNEEYINEVREVGGVYALISLLKSSNNDKIREKSTHILGLLLISDKNRLFLLEQEWVDTYVHSVKEILKPNEQMDTYRRNSINYSLNAMYNLALSHKSHLRKYGIAEFCCIILTSTNDDSIKIHALRALSILATDPKNKDVIVGLAKKELIELSKENEGANHLTLEILNLINANKSK